MTRAVECALALQRAFAERNAGEGEPLNVRVGLNAGDPGLPLLLFVFLFFGLVAVCGTGYVQTGRISVALVLTGVWVGVLTTAILVANNLRDLRGDAATGKLTLAEASASHERTRMLPWTMTSP